MILTDTIGEPSRSEIESLIKIVDDALAVGEFHCIETRWQSKEKLLCVYIDGPNGVDMEGCVRATRLINDCTLLDDVIAGQYTLEVSSPGVDRPLRLVNDFREHVGQRVAVKLRSKIGSRKRGSGILESIDEESRLTVKVGGQPWVFSLEDLAMANVVGNVR